MNNIVILLATYNGCKFIRQQLDSLRNQTFTDWITYIRDDGSTDGTLGIIKEYVNLDPRFLLIFTETKNLGAKKSFFTLLSVINAQYYMFCDQDDIWLETKIEKSLETMKRIENLKNNNPVLVAVDAKVVDESLKVINASFWKFTKVDPQFLIKKKYLQIFNFAPGCTLMFNESLKKLVEPVPNKVLMHDWWLLILAEKYGTISIVNEPLILYRQHSNNTLGANEVNKNYLFSKLKSLNQVFTDQRNHLEFLRDIDGISKIKYYKIKILYNFMRLLKK